MIFIDDIVTAVQALENRPEYFCGPVAVLLRLPEFEDRDEKQGEFTGQKDRGPDTQHMRSGWHAPVRVPERLETRLPKGTERLGDAVHLAPGKIPSFAGKRVALLAHWSSDGSVAPYVLYFLRALRTEGWRTVLASGGEPQLNPALLRLCDAVVWRTCPGYDFTSWKACFEGLPSLFAAEELLLANDSIFAPVGPLSPIHAAMEKVPCDFWGMVGSREFLTHLQSYYLVFRPAALRHPAFAAFWDAALITDDKLDTVLRLEVSLTGWLALNGLIPGVFVPPEALLPGNVNPSHYFWKQLLDRYHVPLIKRDLLRDQRQHPYLRGWENLVARHGYDVRLIHNALKAMEH